MQDSPYQVGCGLPPSDLGLSESKACVSPQTRELREVRVSVSPDPGGSEGKRVHNQTGALTSEYRALHMGDGGLYLR